jgi:hypothetical protein
VRMRNILSLSLFILLLLGTNASAQTTANHSNQPNVAATAQSGPVIAPVARDSELYCAGFIEYAPAPNDLQVVGGEQEQEKRTYAQGDYVYINVGANQGTRAGAEYLVVRPRGHFSSHWSKKGNLGVYTQEVARLRVTNVQAATSVAVVTHSCDQILLGDLLRAVPQRVAPIAPVNPVFDRFAEPSGKQRGRIVLARDAREAPSVSDVVYIDLGSEDNVKEGDRLTIYRPVGTGNITRFRDKEVTPNASYGYESQRFRGGRFSNQAPRVQDPTRDGLRGPIETTPKVKHDRPPVPRKVVGEMVILNVQQRTATAIITRVAQEVHTGDFVEVQ